MFFHKHLTTVYEMRKTLAKGNLLHKPSLNFVVINVISLPFRVKISKNEENIFNQHGQNG